MGAGTKAGTLLEIIVVVVIVGVAALIFSAAGLHKQIEKQRGLEAMNNLQLIYNAEKRHLLDKGDYFSCEGCTSRELTAALGILVSPNYFTYSISTYSSKGGKGFEAVAVRTSGICAGKQMSVNQSSSQVIKECEAWK